MTTEVNIDEILHVHRFLVGRVFFFWRLSVSLFRVENHGTSLQPSITGFFGKFYNPKYDSGTRIGTEKRKNESHLPSLKALRKLSHNS